MSKRVVIVDDESLWRLNVRMLCAKSGALEVVGEAETAMQAVRVINEQNPDVVFLDIDLRGGHSGFDVLPLLQVNTAIVFITSHDEYAIQAFELNALHYLVKPATLPQLRQVLERLPATTQAEDKLVLLKEKDRQRVVCQRDIVAIQSVGDYTRVHIRREDEYLVYKTMKQWGKELTGECFTKLDRSLIVQRTEINGVQFARDGSDNTLTLRNAPPLAIGKTAAHAAEQILKERLDG